MRSLCLMGTGICVCELQDQHVFVTTKLSADASLSSVGGN